jgi:hypothetical protein
MPFSCRRSQQLTSRTLAVSQLVKAYRPGLTVNVQSHHLGAFTKVPQWQLQPVGNDMAQLSSRQMINRPALLHRHSFAFGIYIRAMSWHNPIIPISIKTVHLYPHLPQNVESRCRHPIISNWRQRRVCFPATIPLIDLIKFDSSGFQSLPRTQKYLQRLCPFHHSPRGTGRTPNPAFGPPIHEKPRTMM